MNSEYSLGKSENETFLPQINLIGALPKTPYEIHIEDLFVRANHFYVELRNYIQPLHTFKNDIVTKIDVKPRYSDKQFFQFMDIRLEIQFCSTVPLDPILIFTSSFSVVRNSRIIPSYAAVRLAQYSYEILNDYIKEKPLADKNGKLFVVPTFPFCEDDYKDIFVYD